MYTNTKIMFSKIASVMTIFMMVFSLVGPMNVSAQAEDPITPASEVSETPSDEVIDTTDEEIVEEAPATDTEPTAPEEEGEKKEEVSELSRTALVVIDEPQTATISATKILCPSEDLLPNWGNYGDDITSTTADEFLNAEGNESCEEVDWNFEWSIGAPYVDDNILTGGEGWTSFSDGTTVVPAGENIGLREQMLSGYTTFTGQNVDQNESAEFYCDSDVLNYDNLEYINTEAGETYHCVAFNAHPDMCPNDKGIQTETEDCFVPEDPQEAGICEEGDEEYTSIYTSDEDTMIGEDPAEILTFIHDAWDAVIGDANWIWSTDPVSLTAGNEVEVFTKTFEVEGTPTSASLEIAADNFYSVNLNGEFLCSETVNENNFSTTDTCIIDVADLDTDNTNTLEFTVTNKDINGETTNSNPAGLMYKLTVNGDCAVCEMEQGWDVDYYNYTHTDTGMNLPQSAWYKKSTYGNPLSADNTFVTTADAWTGWSYGMDKYEFSQVESDLMFGSQNFFPFDSGAGLPHKNESLSWSYDSNTGTYTMFDNTPGGKDYHFGLHATGYVTAPSTGDYGFTLTADDDVWIYVNGNLVVDNSGVHGIPGPVTGDDEFIPLNAGVNKVELFYAERHVTQAGLNFSFTDDLKITTTEDCLPPPPVDMCPNIDGVQETVPEGMEKNNDGQCVRTEEPLVCEAGVNLVQNGGFENPVLDSGTWGLFEEGDLLGWMIDWIYGSEGTPTLEIQNNVAGASYEGNQHAELDGNHPVGMYQVIETIPGETYNFSYSYSARPGRDAEDNRIWARVDNNADATLYSADHAIDATYATDTVWTTYSTSFVADSEATIMFHDMGTDTSFGGYIDGVSLTCDPEPEVEMCEWNYEISADSEDCVPPTVLCEDDSAINYGQEGDCMYPENEECGEGEVFNPNTEMCEIKGGGDEEPTPNRSTSGSRSNRSGGSVLGASTDMCAWDASFMRRGWNGNKADDVKTVQNFLNQYMTSGLLVDGIFGLKTEAAVKAFQAKYADDILKPWGINAPTGLFYLSTLTKAKEITCAVDESLPTLINWSANPTVR